MQYFPIDGAWETLPALYDETLNVIQDAVMCDGISIFELSEDGQTLEFVATRTIARDLLKGLTLRLGTGIAGRAAAKGKGVISNSVVSHPDFFALPDHALRFKTRAVLCCPMRHGGRVVGVIELVNKVDGEDFTEAELESAQALADGGAAYWHSGGAAPWESEASGERRETFYELTRMLRKIVDVEGISLFTLDESGESLHLRFSDTTRKTALLGVKLALDQGVAGAVASERRSLVVPDVHREPRFFEGVDAVSMFSTHSIVAVPVDDGGQLLAVLELVNARGSESFTEADRKVLERIAAELSERMVRIG